ncbi:MAG: phosphoribosylamine---glycine ligase, partial [Methylobacteriaceae bacterium]|nr:phosphoribosylamine---glycine ligase [Methylobacteriaceae bacterium]
GGREHALAMSLAKSTRLTKLFIAPGNPGTSQIGENVVLNIADYAAVIDFCRLMRIELVVVGPEQPLVNGLVDALEAAGISAFGPTRAAARLEGSKAFTKELCRRYSIPTAEFERFTDREAALAYVRSRDAPIVVKADGLASGKGVVVAQTLGEAEDAIRSMFSGMFGSAGAEVVIEELLEGEEISFFALCDGKRALSFASAQDHKRVGDGDTGPNTGGMGAYSPAPVFTPELQARVMREIVTPTIDAMAREGAPFKGVLFVGLMITRDGPKLIEFNARFGDPETQAMLPRLESDLLSLMQQCARGHLTSDAVLLSDETALTVVMAAKGYPGAPKKGTEIRGIKKAERMPYVIVTHAGTRREGKRLLADGGRVLNVTALAENIAEARKRAYAAVDAIDWPEGFCRRDIGWRALAPSLRGA